SRSLGRKFRAPTVRRPRYHAAVLHLFSTPTSFHPGRSTPVSFIKETLSVSTAPITCLPRKSNSACLLGSESPLKTRLKAFAELGKIEVSVSKHAMLSRTGTKFRSIPPFSRNGNLESVIFCTTKGHLSGWEKAKRRNSSTNTILFPTLMKFGCSFRRSFSANWKIG